MPRPPASPPAITVTSIATTSSGANDALDIPTDGDTTPGDDSIDQGRSSSTEAKSRDSNVSVGEHGAGRDPVSDDSSDDNEDTNGVTVTLVERFDQ